MKSKQTKWLDLFFFVAYTDFISWPAKDFRNLWTMFFLFFPKFFGFANLC